MFAEDCVIYLFWVFITSVFVWLINIHVSKFKETYHRFIFIVMFCVYWFVFLCILLNAMIKVQNYRNPSGHCYLISDLEASKLLGCVTKQEMLAEVKCVWFRGIVVILCNYLLHIVLQSWTMHTGA